MNVTQRRVGSSKSTNLETSSSSNNATTSSNIMNNNNMEILQPVPNSKIHNDMAHNTMNSSQVSNHKSIREVKSLNLETDVALENNNDINDDDDNNNNNYNDEYDETIPLDQSKYNGDHDYQVARRMRRIKLWKESPFAIGLTEPTWMEERCRDHDSIPHDESGCLCVSAQICPFFGASRVGNMAVLKSSQIMVEDMEYDDETNQQHIRRYMRPRLDIVVGPYWPMLCFVTYPLILGVSGWTLFSGILRPGTSIVLQFVWTMCTLGLIISLTFTAFRDPGILLRNRKQVDPTWRWSDQADTYRPRNAWYDMDTAVMVEGFDHTCPWTGTAIGKKNMLSFQMFVFLVFVCLIMDIFILTGTVSL